METSETIEPREEDTPESEAAQPEAAQPEAVTPESPDVVAAEELLPGVEASPDAQATEDARLKAMLEAVVYVTEEPLTLDQIAAGIGQPRELVEKLLEDL